jgi:uncharacterized protein (TIGR01244 family)
MIPIDVRKLSKAAMKACTKASVRPKLEILRRKESSRMVHKAVAWSVVIIVALAPVVAGCDCDSAKDGAQGPPVKIEDVEGVARGNLYLDGRAYIAGQPTEAAFAELARRGVTLVVNTRTPAEFEDREEVPFDEEEVVRELGMTYVSIPLGGDEHPYEPAAVERLAEALAAADGDVLIHCLYGGRAVYLWMAYLVRNEGQTLERAMARGEAMMVKPHALGRLIGRPTKLVFAE